MSENLRNTNTKITVANFKRFLPESSCSYSVLAKQLGVSKFVLKSWMAKHPKMEKMFNEQKNTMIAEAEDVIFEAIINDRDTRVAQWYLKTMSDIYKEKSEITLDGGLDFNVTIKDAKSKK